jgi:hypothetical protein
MSALDTELLLNLIRARHGCLKQLCELGKYQLRYINENNVTALLDVLAAKQKPLDDVRRIERALDPYRSQDPEKRVWPSTTERSKAAALIKECDAMLAEVFARDKQCESLLVEQREAMGIQLQARRSAGRARGAYNAIESPLARRLDLSSNS